MTNPYTTFDNSSRQIIKEAIENWALWRDSGDWDRFRSLWHDDGVMCATVFQGPVDEFIEQAQRSHERGVTARHILGGTTVDVNEMKPSRAAVNGKYSIEDDLRLPGMADAIERDMRAAMAEDVDRTVFIGDSGANENVADIAGFTTYTGVAEPTLTQTNKVKADETLKVFLTQLDGIYAASLADLRIVASKGANTLWFSTIHAAAVDNQTIAQFLMASGMAWTMRGAIEDNTANNDFGAFMGLARGIEGAAIAAVWDAGQLIRDPYTNSKTGEVELTLNYLWNFKVVRTHNFKRLKFVT